MNSKGQETLGIRARAFTLAPAMDMDDFISVDDDNVGTHGERCGLLSPFIGVPALIAGNSCVQECEVAG
ncbi:Hypothetical protein PHPALM_13824 [Phytophthora palmivora]|uniref:Uncharacterized protein n=1 Tax=Phytophthora palmivora TaxID=4796 RepID=A0A2P4XWD3_9STRA|nr:Hypothetical protein PHPALM_13824 [Phytophthora palmivora]